MGLVWFGLVWFNTISKKYNCWRRANGNFPSWFLCPQMLLQNTHTQYWNTTHHIWNMCLLHLACKILARVFLMFVSLLKIIFFWEEKKVPSCISLLSKKASEEVFIMCTLKKIGFIIWCGTVSYKTTCIVSLLNFFKKSFNLAIFKFFR